MNAQPSAFTPREAHFNVGTHLLRLSCWKGRWTVIVDAAAVDRSYPSEADAWEAGVREADRLDRAVES